MNTDEAEILGVEKNTQFHLSGLASITAQLANATESERYQALGELLIEWAKFPMEGQQVAVNATIETLNNKVNKISKQNAILQDNIATLQADLDHRNTQHEAEQTRGHELALLHAEQRKRLEAAERSVSELETQLVKKNAELHKAQVENENVQLQTQRKEISSDRTGPLQRLEEKNRNLKQELASLRTEIEQQRQDKDVEIESLIKEQSKSNIADDLNSAESLSKIWDRLRDTRLKLVDGKHHPNPQCAKRTADVLIELARFAGIIDQSIRPFLSKYTKQDKRMRVPWEVFANREDTLATIRQTLHPSQGKPVGIVRVRLNGLRTWLHVAMISNDIALESVASELHSFLMGPLGAGDDAGRTIKDFLRKDGPEQFKERIHNLRAERLDETFGRSG